MASLPPTHEQKSSLAEITDTECPGCGRWLPKTDDLGILLCRTGRQADSYAAAEMYTLTLPIVTNRVRFRIRGDKENNVFDISHQAFLKVLHYAHRYDCYQPAIPWLLRATDWAINDHLRDRCRSKLVFASFVPGDFSNDERGSAKTVEPTTPELSPLQNVLEIETRAERSNKLRLLLNQLPTNQRIAFLLFHIEELTYEQIAQKMDTTISNVRNWLHMARTQLGLARTREADVACASDFWLKNSP